MTPSFQRIRPILIAAAIAPLLSGCLAKAALDVATAPVKVAGKAADMATTSQSEADEKRGRAMRKREEQLGQLDRRYWELDSACRNGDDRACFERDQVSAQIDALRRSYPGY